MVDNRWTIELNKAFCPSNIVMLSNASVIIQDIKPKSQHHFLVSPRTEYIKSVYELTKGHLPLLKDMFQLSLMLLEQLQMSSKDFLFGFIRNSSTTFLLMHVISKDFHSKYMKTPRDWTKFNTDIFLPYPLVYSSLDLKGNIEPLNCLQLIGSRLYCNKCKYSSKVIYWLKKHLILHYLDQGGEENDSHLLPNTYTSQKATLLKDHCNDSLQESTTDDSHLQEGEKDTGAFKRYYATLDLTQGEIFGGNIDFVCSEGKFVLNLSWHALQDQNVCQTTATFQESLMCIEETESPTKDKDEGNHSNAYEDESSELSAAIFKAFEEESYGDLGGMMNIDNNPFSIVDAFSSEEEGEIVDEMENRPVSIVEWNNDAKSFGEEGQDDDVMKNRPDSIVEWNNDAKSFGEEGQDDDVMKNRPVSIVEWDDFGFPLDAEEPDDDEMQNRPVSIIERNDDAKSFGEEGQGNDETENCPVSIDEWDDFVFSSDEEGEIHDENDIRRVPTLKRKHDTFLSDKEDGTEQFDDTLKPPPVTIFKRNYDASTDEDDDDF